MFAVGLLAILGVAAALATSSPLGLAMTLVIAGVYVLGALEVKRFALATQGLSQALQDMPPSLTRLDDWLQRVPPALQAAVRQRVTQERGQLPGLALTPYLIGLLVMLGMLGQLAFLWSLHVLPCFLRVLRFPPQSKDMRYR